jgi:hypothetical protein
MVYYNPYSLDNTRLTIIQHLRTLDVSEVKHDLTYYNAFDDYPSFELGEELLEAPFWIQESSFDAIILHYSFLAFHWDAMTLYRWKRLFSWIGELNCLKIAIPQDEGDHAGLLDEWLFDWGVSIIFSVHYTKEGPLYPIMRNYATIYPCLPGYIDETIARRYAEKLLPIAERSKDIVYRARHLPYWFGSAGRLKALIAEVVAPRAEALGFNIDISTQDEDAILGDAWTDLIASGKAVIGTQGGYSVLDWRGEVKAQVRAILKANPDLSFEEVSTRMPAGWDDYQLLTVTPRHFEAVITKTCQVLVEGSYKGVLEANKHYIPIKQDFSNLDEALAKLRDKQYIRDIVECAYNDIYLSGRYSYRTFAEKIDQALCKHQQQNAQAKESVELVTETKPAVERAIAVLERQLITERHNYALQEAKLREASQHIGELTSQLQVRVGELQSQIQLQFMELQTQMQAQAMELQNQMQAQAVALQNQMQTQERELQSRLDRISTQLISRKKTVIFAALITLGSAIISSGLMLLLLFSFGVLK